MRLSKLTIKGFKSFANETVVNFDSNVTGVVGPNGSGKSNIVDSIRWVLGEQKTSELRLDKMSSAIFNGSKRRKPAPSAMVTLTFDNNKGLLNSEYNQLHISRLLYRSGESEYRINNTNCRLKDIQNLFMDTGVGSDSYAIIALSMVDELLNDTDNSRRRMLEEAAGISKYKSRKNEVQRKITYIESDLARVNDLLFEIEGSMKSFEKQAKRAEKYHQLKSEYKELSLKYFAYTYASIKDKLDDIEKNIKNNEQEQVHILNALNKINVEIEKDKLDLLEREKLLKNEQSKINSIVDEIHELEKAIGLNSSQQQHFEQLKALNEKKITTLNQKIETYNTSKGQYNDRVTEAATMHQTLLNKVTEKKGLLQQKQELFNVLTSEKHRITNDFNQLQNSLTECNNQLQVLLGKKELLSSTVTLSNDSISKNQLEHQQLSNQLSGIEGQWLQINGKYEELLNTKKQLEQSETDISQLLSKTEKEYYEALNATNVIKHEIDIIDNMIKSFEGYPESIKFVSKNHKWRTKSVILNDIIGTDNKYKVCIENYLDQFLNYFIVDSPEEAYAIINLLIQSQHGKVGVFVNQYYNTSTASSSEIKKYGIPALQVITYEDKYQHLMEFLFKNVVIVDSKQMATLFHQSTPSTELIFIDEHGSFLNNKGAVYGGSVGMFEGKRIGRKKYLADLEKDYEVKRKLVTSKDLEQKKLSNELEAIQQKLQSIQIDGVHAQLMELTTQKIVLTDRINSLATSITENTGLYDSASKEFSELNTGIQLLQEQVQKLTQEVQVKEKSVQEIEVQFEKDSSNLSVLQEELIQLNYEELKLKTTCDNLEKELQFIDQQVVESEKELVILQAELEHAMQESANLLVIVNEGNKKREEFVHKKHQESESLNSRESLYFEIKNNIIGKEKERDGFNRKYNETGALIQKENELIANLRLERGLINERLEIEFDLAIDALKEIDYSELKNPDSVKEKVNNLRNQLHKFGEVNPMALEAFQEIQLRHQDISSQKNDIMTSMQNLVDTLQEIEQTATQQFMEAFENVKVNFQKVFRTLFTEDDDCDLVLDKPETPLDSKIQIIAKPKGKRPLAVAQLSGGEKALTAIALLFSLYLLKPAPFCIFDEVDAPLDDMNIEKFNKIIKEFSEKSQFIIVTHNKQTMAAVDKIYGIYMPEEGVSSVAPVSFSHLSMNQEMVVLN